MPDDHSEVVPLLPIPNRTVKRLSADDSADSRVKVGHRQALTAKRPITRWGVFYFRIQLCDHSPNTVQGSLAVENGVALDFGCSDLHQVFYESL